MISYLTVVARVYGRALGDGPIDMLVRVYSAQTVVVEIATDIGRVRIVVRMDVFYLRNRPIKVLIRIDTAQVVA
jgi:hypothetical protein